MALNHGAVANVPFEAAPMLSQKHLFSRHYYNPFFLSRQEFFEQKKNPAQTVSLCRIRQVCTLREINIRFSD